MEWRMVFRRCPSRWMTLVGDPAQTSAPAGTDDWAASLAPFVGERFVTHELTVNYRTPAEIMEYAGEVLAQIDPEAQASVAIRETGVPVRRLPAGTDPEWVRVELHQGDAQEQRTVAVIDAANVAQMKGLEFDHVIVVEPDKIIEASPQGWQDLYVAATRATQSLTVIG